MIYPDIDIHKWSEKIKIELTTQICSWGCNSVMKPRPAITYQSKGIKYECQCGCSTYVARPTKDLEFWDSII